VEGTSLPNTGMNSGLLTLLGAGCIAVGALAIRRGRHWRSAR
jgi:LPXTG-motif cell wall-anchored protein